MKIYYLLCHIGWFNPKNEDKKFKNKIEEFKRDANRQAQEVIGLILAKKKVLDKQLSSERIQKFLQFEAYGSHLGDKCQVCMEVVEVGRLMKQLDCGGRHSFCSIFIDKWLAEREHKTCPICRHVFV